MNPITPHNHNGVDSPKLYAGDTLEKAPQEALTTGTVETAGPLYTVIEKDMINNFKTRIAEIELALQTLGLLK